MIGTPQSAKERQLRDKSQGWLLCSFAMHFRKASGIAAFSLVGLPVRVFCSQPIVMVKVHAVRLGCFGLLGISAFVL